ncbi:alpha/beta hydrolase [Hymenobacter negativus]|uniref:Alpha/beta hydrolase n=1 Tax=Hymenobacter negativus TaxID=2795026 RepID=A0ABS3QCE1_9BACT|nr:alpha/beta hydrolase [Hymenobacter negativus]MBO2008633.1 alpha/beta hydrolase [Hymenobacter negativus]
MLPFEIPGTVHCMMLADSTAMAAMRVATAPVKGKVNGPAARPLFDDIMQHTPVAEGVTFAADTVGGVPGWWCCPATNTMPGSTVLYLHGGAYVLGSALAYRNFVSQLVLRTGAAFFVPDYRLAPEHPFPAAVDDALAAYRGLVELGKTHIAVAGDSAGGGLALVTVAEAIRAAGQAEPVVPRATLVFSPWTDVALTSASMQAQAEADPVLTQESLAACAALYLHGHDAHDPQASPVYGDLAGLPPVQVHVGEAEVLLNDSTRYVVRAQAAGSTTDLHFWEGMPHVFPTSVGVFQAAGLALDLAGSFLAKHLG